MATGSDTAADDTASGPATSVRLYVTAELEMPIGEMVRLAPWISGVEVSVDADPVAAAAAESEAGVFPVAVAADRLECTECFAIEAGESQGLIVAAGDVLGAQYGVDDLFERAGVRFFTPFSGYAPEDVVTAISELPPAPEQQSPEIAERGVQLHTLHTIEAVWAFVIPGEDNLERARTFIDYYVKQRANYLQWVPLDDIIEQEGAYEPWREHVLQIIDYAHARGVRVGMNIQMLGEANLQRAYDLLEVTGPEEEEDAMIEERLIPITDGLDFDRFALSFGEFILADPETFIGRIDRIYDKLQELKPGIEMGTKIHVGDVESLRVDYMGENYIFYMLATFANPEIVPWIHTVMYYNLYQSASGAYAHADFAEHREMYLDLYEQGRPVGYFPETAYWVAFDNSVPTYLPVYMDSRLLDIAQLADDGAPLDYHVTFSSGFEWGYWQNDYAVFRWNWALTPDTNTVLEEMFAPFGEDGIALATIIAELGSMQSELLLDQQLGAYLAGRDISIDAAFDTGVVSQPDRVGFLELSEMPDAERNAFLDNEINALSAHADALDLMLPDVEALTMEGGERWRDEVYDGMEVDLHRIRFIVALYRASAAFGAGEDPTPFLDEAQAEFDAGQVVVDRRHANLHDPEPGRLLGSAAPNPTRYPNGYLHKADTLCYWQREREKVDNVIAGVTTIVTPCFEIGG